MMPGLAIFTALGVFAVMSSAWSATPVQSLLAGLTSLGLLAASIVILASEDATAAPVVRACLWGFLMAFAVGLMLSVVEIATDQGLMRWAIGAIPALQQDLGKHTFMSDGLVTSVSEAMANRRTAILSLLFLPTLLLLCGYCKPPYRPAAAAILTLMILTAVYGSHHQSSQLAVAAGGAVLVVSMVFPAIAARAVLAGWVGATLLMVPFADVLMKVGAHEAPWLPESARQRVVIWATTAELTLQAPALGIGAEATAAGPGNRAVKPVAPGATTSVHAHNAYLQIWYELGAVGAVLTMLAGLAAWRQVVHLSDPWHRRIALAQFAVIGAMIATSYGIWQPWFLSSIALSVVFTVLVMRALERGSANVEALNCSTAPP